MEKVLFWLKKHKNEILVGLVGTLILRVIETVIDWAESAVPTAGITLLRVFVDRIYYKAAQANHDVFANIIASMLIGFLCALIVIVLHLAYKRAKIKLDNPASKNVAGDIEKMEKTASHSDKLTTVQKISAITTPLLLIVFVFSWFAYAYIPVGLLNRFERDIKVISPYVDEVDIRKLESKWVLMTGYDDYAEIYEYIDEIKEQYNGN